MADRRTFNVVVLGLGFLFIFTAFTTCGNIEVSLFLSLPPPPPPEFSPSTSLLSNFALTSYHRGLSVQRGTFLGAEVISECYCSSGKRPLDPEWLCADLAGAHPAQLIMFTLMNTEQIRSSFTLKHHTNKTKIYGIHGK